MSFTLVYGYGEPANAGQVVPKTCQLYRLKNHHSQRGYSFGSKLASPGDSEFAEESQHAQEAHVRSLPLILVLRDDAGVIWTTRKDKHVLTGINPANAGQFSPKTWQFYRLKKHFRRKTSKTLGMEFAGEPSQASPKRETCVRSLFAHTDFTGDARVTLAGRISAFGRYGLHPLPSPTAFVREKNVHGIKNDAKSKS